MNLPLYWVDAFTDKVFGGNPAAVVPLESWPGDALLQRIANENGLSETAFFVRTGPASADLKWFTPEVEIDLCGHATLAAAHVLYREMGQKESPFSFRTKSGILTVAAKGALFELDFPSRPAAHAAAPDALVAGLGAKPRDVLRSERMWLMRLIERWRRSRRFPLTSRRSARSPPGTLHSHCAWQGLRLCLTFFCPGCRCQRGSRHRLRTLHARALLGGAPRQDRTPCAPAVAAARGNLVRPPRGARPDGRQHGPLPDRQDHGLSAVLAAHFSFIS